MLVTPGASLIGTGVGVTGADSSITNAVKLKSVCDSF